MPDAAQATPSADDDTSGSHVRLSIYFAQIPEALLYDPNISADAVRVYGVLHRHGQDPRNCYPSHARIARFIGRAKSSIPAWIRELVVAGWVEVVARRTPEGDPDSNGYVVHLVPLEAGRGGVPAPPPRGVPADEQGGVPVAQQGGSLLDSAPNESKENESKGNEENPAPSPPPSAPADDAPSAEVIQLCTQLADAVERYRDGAQGGRPKVTKTWHRDMRLLLERGPLGADQAVATPAEKIAGCIRVVFTELADPQGSSGFCWASNVQSPAALRRHWWKLYEAAVVARRRSTSGRLAAVSRQVTGGEPEPLAAVLGQHAAAMAERRGLQAPAQLPALGAAG